MQVPGSEGGGVNNVRNWPTLKLLSLLPHASGVLREQIEAQLKVRFEGTQILPMMCVKITGAPCPN